MLGSVSLMKQLALKSPKHERRKAAEQLMDSLRMHSGRVIEQATLVSQELVRVAILWEEIWHETLDICMYGYIQTMRAGAGRGHRSPNATNSPHAHLI